MDAGTAKTLLDLNSRFYQTFGREFAATRGHVQPGVRQMLDTLRGDEAILDLGCGNGTLAIELARRKHSGPYLGLDSSAPLLEAAREQKLGDLRASFVQADLTRPTELTTRRAEIVTCFAVLHHLPIMELRLSLLQWAYNGLSGNGRLFLSNWQFLNSPKLRQRIQPWDVIGLKESDVDPGDHLLDWRAGGRGLRYAHHFTAAELEYLATASGFRIRETFHSDGATHDLSLYQTWEKPG